MRQSQIALQKFEGLLFGGLLALHIYRLRFEITQAMNLSGVENLGSCSDTHLSGDSDENGGFFQTQWHPKH